MAEGKKSAMIKAASKLILGLVLILLGAVLILKWRWYVLALIKGCIGFVLLLTGAIFLVIAKE